MTRDLTPRAGSIAYPPYMFGPSPRSGPVPLQAVRPRGMRVPNTRDEYGRAVRVAGPTANTTRPLPRAARAQPLYSYGRRV